MRAGHLLPLLNTKCRSQSEQLLRGWVPSARLLRSASGGPARAPLRPYCARRGRGRAKT